MNDYVKMNHNKAYFEWSYKYIHGLSTVSRMSAGKSLEVNRNYRTIFIKVRSSIHHTVTPDLCYCSTTVFKVWEA